MVSPAVIMDAILDVSLLLIGLWKLNDFPKFMKFLSKNLRIFEIKFSDCSKFSWPKNRSYVTLGKMLLGKMLPRQIVT